VSPSLAPTPAGIAAVLVLAGLLTLAGHGLLRFFALPHRGAGHRLVFSLLSGLLAWHLLLQALTLAGVPWKRSLLAVLLVLLAWACRRAGRRRPRPPRRLSPAGAGWGDAAAILAVLAFALLAPTLWITTPDFAFHWGLKGEHAFLARGIDYAWLARSWNYWAIHPDYPHLLPILYASSARLALRFDAAALQLWSVLFLGGIVLAARAAFREAGVGRGALQGGTALVGFAATAYSVGYLMAGGADGMMALALAAALPALFDREAGSTPAADLEIGIAAAFAAASKIEGVPLAAFLIAVHLLRRGLALRRTAERRVREAALALARTAGPAFAIVLPWIVQVLRYHLFQAGNSGPFDWRRGSILGPAFLDAMRAPELHLLPWAVALLPLLWLARRTRAAAAVATAQLGFYMWAYFASLLDPRFYVLSSFARLLFQLLPAVLVGVVVAIPALQSLGSEAEREA
jgi:hypothetical protein